jgi:hypothetical protein
LLLVVAVVQAEDLMKQVQVVAVLEDIELQPVFL